MDVTVEHVEAPTVSPRRFGLSGQPVGGGADHTVIIEAPGRWAGFGLAELWAYRSLFFFLVWRSIKVRYAQTVMGLGWAVIQPLMTMLVFTVVFGKFANIPSDGVPYPIFSFAALVPWAYFSHALAGSTNSLVGNTNLITKVYFPRLIIPYAPVLSALVDFSIAFAILLVMMLGYGTLPAAGAVIMIPLLLMIAVMTAAGVGCWLSAINIQYRDVKHMTTFLIQLWMYATPIVYPLSIVPDAYRPIYMLNPMVGVTEGFRTFLLGTGSVTWTLLSISAGGSVLLFVTGSLYFRRTERIFADVA
jgi:lipopolysaccharide transport system permease protein